MADNFVTNSGTGGNTYASDDIAGIHYPRVKLSVGADGAATDVSDSNPMPIDDAGGSITVDGTVTANLSATDNAVLDSIDTAVNGTLTVGSHDVTNAGTFAVQISDTSFAVADGNALGEGILIQGDDGTDRKNINVDPTTGDVQVDVTNTVTVDGSGVTQPVSGTVTANLSATDNAVLDQIEVNTSYGDSVGGGTEAAARPPEHCDFRRCGHAHPTSGGG